MAIGLCVTAALSRSSELRFRDARGHRRRADVGLVPIALGLTAFGLVVAKYLA